MPGGALHLAGAVGSAALHLGGGSAPDNRQVTLTGTTAGATMSATASYDLNLLSDVFQATSERWRGADTIPRAARIRFAGAPLAQLAARLMWAPGDLGVGPAAERWRESDTSAHGAQAAWRHGLGMRGPAAARWIQSPLATVGAGERWHDGRSLPAAAGDVWIGLPLGLGPLGDRWRGGALVLDGLRIDIEDGRSLRPSMVQVWRHGVLVGCAGYRPYPMPQPPQPPPPVWSARLCLRLPLGGPLSLGRTCPISIPAVYSRRTYHMIHDLSVTRLSDGMAVAASVIDLSLDADSWAWAWAANLLGTGARDLVMPSSEGEPVLIEIAIDGYSWQTLVETVPLDDEHGRHAIRAAGRGLTAELAAPSYLPEDGYLENARTMQQAMGEQLPIDNSWTLTRDASTPDWLLPAGALNWRQQTPIQVIHGAAQGTGLVVVPAMADRAINVQPRYKVPPWDYAAATPDLVISESVIRRRVYAANRPAQANAVYVHGGESGGILARVYREGTAGDLLLTTTSHEAITHVDAARTLGTRLLAAEQRQPDIVSVTLPLGQDIPLVGIGDLVAIEMHVGGYVRGIVGAVAIHAERGGHVSQTIRLGGETGNRWAAWRGLTRPDPLLWATVLAIHADGTGTVEYPGGGRQRVAGDAAVDDVVWVKSRRIEGVAPALPAYDMGV